MTDSDSILDILKMARGDRPASLDNGEAEEVLTIALALVVELSVANDRIERLEGLVAELRGEGVDMLRAAPLTAEATTRSQAATDALMMRALRVFFDGRQPTHPTSSGAA